MMSDWSIAIFYYLFGTFTIMYILVLSFSQDRKKGKKSLYKDVISADSANVRFYLNMYFMDRKELVMNIVRSKISKNMKIMRAVAKRLAVHLLEDAIVEKIGITMMKSIPERLEMMGLKSTASIVYTKSAYVCVEVVLHRVDLPQLIGNMSGSQEKAENVRKFLSLISFPSLDAFMNKWMVQFMCNKVIQQVPAQVQTKLQDKLNAEVIVIACTEEEQGPLLVSTIQELNLCNKDATNSNTAAGGGTSSDADLNP